MKATGLLGSGDLTIVAPGESIAYELRLMRGEETLAWAFFTSVAEPEDGILALEEDRPFQIHEPVRLSIANPTDRVLPGRCFIQVNRSEWQMDGGAIERDRDAVWTFDAEVDDTDDAGGLRLDFSAPARYEVRLIAEPQPLESWERDFIKPGAYLLASLELEVTISALPGALSLGSEGPIITGTDFSLRVDIPEEFTRRHAKLIIAATEPHRETHLADWLEQPTWPVEMPVRAPDIAGRWRCYIKVRDMMVDELMLDVIPPPNEGIRLEVEQGANQRAMEPITCRVHVPAAILNQEGDELRAVVHRRELKLPGGAVCEAAGVRAERIPSDGQLEFRYTPTQPGTYELRLIGSRIDWQCRCALKPVDEDVRVVLESHSFEVQRAEYEKLRLDDPAAGPAEIELDASAYEVRQTIVASYRAPVAGEVRVHRRRPIIDVGGGDYGDGVRFAEGGAGRVELRAPAVPGDFVVCLFLTEEHDSYGEASTWNPKLVGVVPLSVQKSCLDGALSVSSGTAYPGEALSIRIEIPESAVLLSQYLDLKLTRLGTNHPDGAAEPFVEWTNSGVPRRVWPDEAPSVDVVFEAPERPGPYIFRLCDDHYTVAKAPLTVLDPSSAIELELLDGPVTSPHESITARVSLDAPVPDGGVAVLAIDYLDDLAPKECKPRPDRHMMTDREDWVIVAGETAPAEQVLRMPDKPGRYAVRAYYGRYTHPEEPSLRYARWYLAQESIIDVVIPSAEGALTIEDPGAFLPTDPIQLTVTLPNTVDGDGAFQLDLHQVFDRGHHRPRIWAPIDPSNPALEPAMELLAPVRAGQYELDLVAGDFCLDRTGFEVIDGDVMEGDVVDLPNPPIVFPRVVRGVEVFYPKIDEEKPTRWDHLLLRATPALVEPDQVLLLVYGWFLVDGGVEGIELHTDDERVLYEVLWNTEIDWLAPHPEEYEPFLDQLKQHLDYPRAGVSWPDGAPPSADYLGADAVVIRARFAPDMTTGFKTFTLNGATAEWMLPRGAVSAELSFARHDAALGFESTDTLFVHDCCVVDVELSAEIEEDQIQVLIAVDGKPVGEEFTARRLSGNRRVYRTTVVEVGEPPPTALGFKATDGSVLQAILSPFEPAFTRLSAQAQVVLTPSAKNGWWLKAVVDAAVALDSHPDDLNIDDIIHSDTSWHISKYLEHYENWYRTEAAPKWLSLRVPSPPGAPSLTIEVSFGQLAAMLLLRDAFVEQLTEALADLLELRHIASESDGVAIGFLRAIAPHASKPGQPFSLIEVTPPTPNVGGILLELHRLYDEEWLRKVLPVRSQRMEYLANAGREALAAYFKVMREAATKAREMPADDVMGLVELTGTGFGALAQRLRTTLVRLETDPSKPLRWNADPPAREYLDSIEELGRTLRERDDAYQDDRQVYLAVASLVLFGPNTWLFRVLSYAVGVAIVGEVWERQFPECQRRQDELRFALGGVPVLGPERYQIAEMRLIPKWAPVVELALAIVGHVFESIRLALRATKAKWPARLLRRVGKKGAPAYMEMTPSEQVRVFDASMEAAAQAAKGEAIVGQQKVALNCAEELRALESVSGSSTRPGMKPCHFHPPPQPGVSKAGTRVIRELEEIGLPKPNTAWKTVYGGGRPRTVQIGRYLGRGSFCGAYVMRDRATRAMKLLFTTEGADICRRARAIERVLKDLDIAQLKILEAVWEVPEGQMPYIIQEALRAPGKLIRLGPGGILDEPVPPCVRIVVASSVPASSPPVAAGQGSPPRGRSGR